MVQVYDMDARHQAASGLVRYRINNNEISHVQTRSMLKQLRTLETTLTVVLPS